MNRYRSLPARASLVLAAAVLSLAVRPGAAAPAVPGPQASAETVELIVLLAASPSTPTPEAAVDDVNRGRSPFHLPVQPLRARTALPSRATGETLDWLRAHPGSPRARLERYVVLSFPPNANLEAVKIALAASPHVLNVEENLPFKLSVVPTDPYMQNTGNPPTYQWGSFTLNLPAAWDRIHGHAYVGLTDTGLEVNHPDLRPYHLAGSTWVFDGGGFRPHFSYDFGYGDANVDEADRPSGTVLNHLGHGTHTSGILAASTNNGTGVAGACWNCSLMMAKVSKISSAGDNGNLTTATIGAGINWLVDRGAQVQSSSFGGPGDCGDNNHGDDMICSALAYAEERDVLLFAASGNDLKNINFPARDPRVISVGGISPDSSFWVESVCPQPGYTGTTECGSNYTMTPGSAMQTLVAPAKSVLSTTYAGWTWIDGKCADGTAYGLCTGTSMSSPYAAGVGALVRSANPLLTKATVRTILINTASRAGSWHPQLGYGIPNADAAVQSAMGKAGGQVLANRLTPLFSFYSLGGEDHYYTTVPQMASAAIFDAEVPYRSVGPVVNGYINFPGVSTCTPACNTSPRASVYIFTSDRLPYPGALALVPLYRMSFKGTNPNGNASHRDTTYTTQSSGITTFKSLGYELDGIEGYIHPVCSPEPGCLPSGAVRLYRRYHPQRDDFAIFPESELAQMEALGYTSTGGVGQILGYVYPNADSDGDRLIDGFESLIGTQQQAADSDGDGIADGDEVLSYPYCDPLNPGCSGTSVWVSVNGNDANDCSRATPCRTFAGALVKVSPGGEINIADSGDFGPVTINKAVSLVAKGALGGIHAGTGSAITINAGANDRVVLHGLTLDGIGTGATGVSFLNGGSLYIENCTVNNFGQYGIDFAPANGSGRLFVTDTVLRNNGRGTVGGGLHLIATTGAGFAASVDGLRSESNVFGLKAEFLGSVSVRNSLVANNGYAGFSAVASSGSGNVRMLIEDSVSTHNGTNGVSAVGFVTVTIGNVVVTNNQNGLLTSSGGLILSFGNNRIQGNATDGAPSQTVANQ